MLMELIIDGDVDGYLLEGKLVQARLHGNQNSLICQRHPISPPKYYTSTHYVKGSVVRLTLFYSEQVHTIQLICSC